MSNLTTLYRNGFIYGLGLCTWISTCSFRANLRVICGHSEISINSENEQENTLLLKGKANVPRFFWKQERYNKIAGGENHSDLNLSQYFKLWTASPWECGCAAFFSESPLIWNLSLLRSKQWVHSMAFDCSCTLLISKFQLTISTLLWVSKWNTLIKLECLALFQAWEFDHAGFNGGSIFCLV